MSKKKKQVKAYCLPDSHTNELHIYEEMVDPSMIGDEFTFKTLEAAKKHALSRIDEEITLLKQTRQEIVDYTEDAHDPT